VHPDNGGIEQRHEFLPGLDELAIHDEHPGQVDPPEPPAIVKVVLAVPLKVAALSQLNAR
jgi:hypothetical protein